MAKMETSSPLSYEILQDFPPPIGEILCRKNNHDVIATSGVWGFSKKDTSSPGVIKLMPRKKISGIRGPAPTTIVSPDHGFRSKKRPVSSIDSDDSLSNLYCNGPDSTELGRKTNKFSDILNIDALSLHSPVARLPNSITETPTPPPPYMKHPKSKDALLKTPKSEKLGFSHSNQEARKDQNNILSNNLPSLPLDHYLVATPPIFQSKEEQDNDEEMALLATSPGMALYVQRAARKDTPFSTPSKNTTTKIPMTHLTSRSDIKRTPVRKLSLTPRKTPRRSIHENPLHNSSMVTNKHPLKQRLTPPKNEENCSRILASSPPPEQVSVSSNHHVCPPRPVPTTIPSCKTQPPCYVMIDNCCDNKSLASDISHLGDLCGDDDDFILASPQVLLDERTHRRGSYDSLRNTKQRRH